MDYNKEEILSIFDTEENITATARIYCEKHGIEYTDGVRRKFSHIINKHANISDNDTDSIDYAVQSNKIKMLTAFDEEGNLMNIDEYCDKYGLDRDSVRSFKLISHTGLPYYNIVFKEEDAVYDITKDTDFLDEVLSKYIESDIDKPVMSIEYGETVDRLILSDIHIGMDNTGDSNVEPIYSHIKYDLDELSNRLNSTVNHILKYKKSTCLIIDNLGDYLDGLQGQTTRGGHKLPQLMSDKEVFDTGIWFKVSLAETLLKYYDKIVFNNVINDNHSFLFGYFVHSAVKKILESKYPGQVEYNLHERFISHYSVGKHTFILCHGKDASDMKFGMKLNIDDKIAGKIDQYCKEYGLYNGNLIEFSKGDLHQYVVDTTGRDFEYVNYPSFAPPSSWVQTNFGNCKSGFVFQIIELDSKDKVTIPKWF